MCRETTDDNRHPEDDNDTSSDAAATTTICWKQEALALLNLALPTVVIQLSIFCPPFLTASYVGRLFGSVYLDGFTLASLTTNLFTLALLQGLYSASDTLGPQAFGAGNQREVGLLAIRGYLASLAIVIPIASLVAAWLQPALLFIGVEAVSARLAAEWYRIYALGLPFYALFMVTWRFLSAQEILMPVVIVSVVSSAVVLPVTLQLWTTQFGFLGSAYANFFYQASQACLLLLYLLWNQPHAPDSWPGILNGWRDAIKRKPLQLFCLLGAGGMLAASEWIYWETLSLMVGTLGVVPLSVHTIPTQVLTLSFMVPLGIGVALSVRLGSTLPRCVAQAKRLVLGAFFASTALITLMTAAIYYYRNFIFHFFSSEPEVLQGCEDIWWHVCLYFFNLSVFGINVGIAVGLGMQWTLGIINFVALWGVGLPAAYYFGIHVHQSLDVVWCCVYPPYAAMNLVLTAAFLSIDWHAISRSIQVREGIEHQHDHDNNDGNNDELQALVSASPSPLSLLATPKTNNYGSAYHSENLA